MVLLKLPVVIRRGSKIVAEDPDMLNGVTSVDEPLKRDVVRSW
jgi:hypothetical protein